MAQVLRVVVDSHQGFVSVCFVEVRLAGVWKGAKELGVSKIPL